MATETQITDENLAKSRVLVCRLSSIGKAIDECLKVIAFWLWLETRWNIEFIIRDISGKDDEFLGLITDEAIAIYSSVMGSSGKIVSPDLVKHTLTLSKRFLSLSSMFSDNEMVMKGISDIYSGLCRVHFPYASGSKPFKLNPCAKEWNPVKERAPEEDRCLFLTFSNGYPLTESQIVGFFSRKYGQCIERVYVHWPDARNGNRHVPALFGKVVFKTASVPVQILRGEKEAKFWVDRKPLWCKRFDSDKKKKSG